MKKTISFSDFCDEFKAMGRDNSFSYQGKKALFDYLEELEQSCDTEFELDIIALDCDFYEYSSLEEIATNYTQMQELEGYDKDLDSDDEQSEEWREEAINWLNYRTQVIEFNDGIIIQAF